MKRIGFLLCMIIISINSCKDNSTESPIDDTQKSKSELVKVRFDMQYGFAGKAVYINLNDEENYYSILSSGVSLSGPEASFSTHLPRGQNKISVFLGDPQNIYNNKRDTTVFYLGTDKKYILGLRFTDKIEVLVQDSSMVYY
jgi:hypothetical protein